MDKINRLKELWCVINGHNLGETCTESDEGFVLRRIETCGHCGISVIDESGYKQKAMECMEWLNKLEVKK